MSKTVLLLIFFSRFAGATCCANHGGPVKRERQEHTTICSDGTSDKTCSGSSQSHMKSGTGEASFHFKPVPDRGQILLPGEKAPTTTLKNSISPSKSE